MSTRSIIHFIAIVFIVLSGLLEFIGFPTAMTKAFCLFFLLIMFGREVVLGHSKVPVYALILVFFMMATMLIHLTSSNYLALSVSMFQIWSPFLVFYLLYSLQGARSKDTSKILLFVLSIQMAAAMVKFILVGQNEGQGVGTISIQAGSLSTYIVCILCVTTFAFKSSQKVVLICLVSALVFTIINEKRLGIIIVLIFSMIHYLRFSGSMYRLVLTYAMGIGLISLTVYFGARFIPTLLDGYSILEFDTRVINYLMQTTENGEAIGRLAGSFQTLERVASKDALLFGLGPAEFLSSNITGTNEMAGAGFNIVGSTLVIARFGLVGFVMVLFSIYSLYKLQLNTAGKFLVGFVLFDFIIYSGAFFLSYISIYALILLRGVDDKFSKIL
jgi:hypothetical protein